MKKTAFFPCVFLMFLIPFALLAISPIDLMPKDNEIAGWIVDTNTICFDGIVENPDQLFLLIDGPGEQYVPYGFIRGAFKGYIDTLHPPDNIVACIEIFDQATHENALEVFKVTGIENYEYEIVQIGDTARIDTIFLSSICLEMVSKNYFLRLYIYNKTDPFKEVLLNMASVIVQNITPIINAHPDTYNKQVSLSILPAKQGVLLKLNGTLFLKNSLSLSKISIYNSKGNLIKKLHFIRSKNSNDAVAIWDGKNRKGMKVSSGSYIAVLYVENNCFVEKFILP